MTIDQSLARPPFFVWSGLGVLTALMFVWPLQYTIALRYWLLGLGLIWSLVGWYAYGGLRERGGLPRLAWIMLVLLTIWMYVGAFGWALSPQKTLQQIGGQWLITLISFAIGVSAAYLLPDHRRVLARLLFAVLAVYVFFIGAVDLVHLFQHGHLMRRYGGLTGGDWFIPGASPAMDKANYLTNIYFAFLLSEFVMLRTGKPGVLGLRYLPILVLFVAGLFASYIEDMRNGSAAFALMIVLAGVLMISVVPRERRGRAFAIMALVLALVGGYAGYVVSHQSRWKTLLATVPIAWNTQNNRDWMTTRKLPKFPDGQTVNVSNYQRIAWAKEAMIVLWHYPLGVGFQRQAFGDGIDALYHTDLSRGMHSHSGILDFSDGVGFPGLIMWVIFVVSIWVSALMSFRRKLAAPAAVLLILVFDYSARSVVDSILRDHMWQQFMFLAGFFTIWASIERYRNGRDA